MDASRARAIHAGQARRGRRAVAVAALLLVSVVLAACGPLTSAGGVTGPTSTAPSAGGAVRVLTLGDSAMVDASGAIAAAFGAGGAQDVESLAQSGFGLTGMNAYDYHTESLWRTEWATEIEEMDPQLSIVMLGGWDYRWLDEHGPEAYARVVLSAVDLLSSRGGKVLWLSMLPGGETGSLSPVDEVLASIADARPGTLWYLNIARSLEGPAGGYPRDFVDDAGRPVKLRKLDDWHLCQDGAARLAAMVHGEAVELGLSGPAPAGWEDGPWRDAVAFDSPACWPRG